MPRYETKGTMEPVAYQPAPDAPVAEKFSEVALAEEEFWCNDAEKLRQYGAPELDILRRKNCAGRNLGRARKCCPICLSKIWWPMPKEKMMAFDGCRKEWIEVTCTEESIHHDNGLIQTSGGPFWYAQLRPIREPAPQPDPVQAVVEAWTQFKKRGGYIAHEDDCKHVKYYDDGETGICTCNADELTDELNALEASRGTE